MTNKVAYIMIQLLHRIFALKCSGEFGYLQILFVIAA